MDLKALGTMILVGLGIVVGLLSWGVPNASRRTRAIGMSACFALFLIGAGFSLWGPDSKAKTAATATTVPSTTSNPPIVLAPGGEGTEVRACMAQHGMTRAITTSTTLVEARGMLPNEAPETANQDHVTVFQKCDWPPKPWSDPDGYSQISVQSTIGPGDSEASDASTADIIKSDCKLLEVQYSVAAQGYQERLPKFRSKPYRAVYYFRGEEYRGSLEPLYYEANELIVLRNSKVRLDRVHCVQ